MPKYFYTDPLKAAWMAREYGMEFISSCTGDNIDWANDFCEVSPQGWNCSKFYIHPDSLHILGPKVDDIMWWTCGDGLALAQATSLLIQQDGGREIIQRNGKAFFAPEVEQ